MGDSRVLGSSSSGGEPTAAVAAPLEGGGGDGGSNHSGEEGFRSGGGGGEDLLGGGERMSFGGNRWPRQETLALLQIRSDMDVAFRDASAKGPLWEEVSRKLAALGYHRSAKKCKEKFENVYKYHRRTKEGRTGKSDGKTYRFFDQLNALENQPPAPNQTTMPAVPAVSNPPPTISHLHSTVTTGTITTSTASATVPLSSSAAPHPTVTTMSSSQGVATPALNNLRLLPNSFPATNPIVLPPPSQPPPPRPPTTTNPTNINHGTTFPSNFPTTSTDLMSNSTSSSTSSDDDLERRAKRKRKWKDFFERLMREVIQKQEDLQMRFLEAIEKREQDRMVREEAWRMQEMARMNREREILAQERSVTAAKDAAVMSFLQKISEQQQPNLNYQNSPQPVQQPPQPPPPRQKPSPAPTPPAQTQQPSLSFEIAQRDMNNSGEMNNNEVETMPVSSSRWPKVEVQALIKLRTSLDSKYLENGPKGPLWEEISGAMKKLGYNRNAKRCKEKWENINKYFKKVKESNKRRPEDSKTCPYFHLLDSLYRERNNNVGGGPNSSGQFRPENAAPLMVRPEQQWPPPQQQQQQQLRDEALMDIDLQQQQQQHQHHQNQEEDHGDKGNIGDEDDDDEEDDEEDEEEDEDDDGNYEIVANKPAPVGAAAAE